MSAFSRQNHTQEAKQPEAASKLSDGATEDAIKRALTLLESTGRYLVSTKIDQDFINGHRYSGSGQEAGSIGIGVVLDNEATGLKQDDKIIQLSMVKFEFNRVTGQVIKALGRYNQYQDPGFPISEEITKLTGITDEMVAGKQIDQAEVGRLIDGVDIVIAHNAGFDRPIMETNFTEISGILANVPWACSYNEIPWSDMGYGSAKLDYLLMKHQYFFEAHRADYDTEALLMLLDQPGSGGNTLLAGLYDSCLKDSHRIWAMSSPFETKDILKERGYRWSDGSNGDPKCWHRDVDDASLDDEIEWLEKNVYKKRSMAIIDHFSAKSRYSVLGDDLRTDIPAQGESYGIKF